MRNTPYIGMSMKILTDDEKYDIVVKRNKKYDGVFWFCAKSSECYCMPSCKARTPMRQNIRYFDSQMEAKNAGYRPCKRCRPDKFVSTNNKL